MEKVEFENQLFEAIKKDDLKSFDFLMPSKSDLNISFGRFPLLSLLYLYSSVKILKKYESYLLSIHNYKMIDERFEIYKLFKTKAKKSLRLFNENEIVYPILMLAVLNENIVLQTNYDFLFKDEKIEQKLKKIYKINYNLAINNGQDKPRFLALSNLFKNEIIKIGIIICFTFALLFSGFAVMFVKNNIGFGTSKNPTLIETESEFIQALKNGKKYYKLTSDIYLSSDFEGYNFSGTIDGNGHLLKINGDKSCTLFETLSGSLLNLRINLDINQLKITKNNSIISKKLTGKIENCFIVGNFDATIKNSSEDDLFVALIACINEGEISKCNVDVCVSVSNESQSNAYFSFVAGKNSGKISDCCACDEVTADTVDIAGIACINNGTISGCENKANLQQTSSKEWHPNVAGISITNNGTILDCKNSGNIVSTSTIAVADADKIYYVFAGGISCDNYVSVKGCKNTGLVKGESSISQIVIGGISAQNSINSNSSLAGEIDGCVSRCMIAAFSQSGQVVSGGVVGYNASKVVSCGFVGEIDADTNSTSNKSYFTFAIEKPLVLFAGGVVGCNSEAEIKNCYASAAFTKFDAGTDYLKSYAGIVGEVGIVNSNFNEVYTAPGILNVENNYYVKQSTIAGAYGIDAILLYNLFNLTYVSGTSVAVTNELVVCGVESINDIPLEVTNE